VNSEPYEAQSALKALANAVVPAAVLKERLGLDAIRKRRQRKPTLASVAKQASKAGIEVARYEIEPNGKIVVVTGKPGEQDSTINEWDDLYGKDKAPTRQ
jgi:hypothetical protein